MKNLAEYALAFVLLSVAGTCWLVGALLAQGLL